MNAAECCSFIPTDRMCCFISYDLLSRQQAKQSSKASRERNSVSKMILSSFFPALKGSFLLHTAEIAKENNPEYDTFDAGENWRQVSLCLRADGRFSAIWWKCMDTAIKKKLHFAVYRLLCSFMFNILQPVMWRAIYLYHK